MRINKIVSSIVSVAFIANLVIPAAFAEAPAPFEPSPFGSDISGRIKILEDLQKSYEANCINHKGYILLNTAVTDADEVKSGRAPFFCEDEAEKIVEMQLQLEAELKLFEKENSTNCVNCPAKPEQAGGTAAAAEKIAAITDDLANAESNSCKASEPAQGFAECQADMLCSVMRSVLPNLPAKSKAFAKLPKDNIFKATAECLDSSKNSCLTEIINGAIVDIWANIEGLWTLLKGAGKLAAFGWKSMWGIEDKSTDAMHAALGQTGDAIAMFIKNPIAFLKQMVSGLIDYTNEAIKNNFGCEKWSGTPHFSTCLQPMPSWSCATCNQRINAVCGVAGALGGELLLAFATGGTVAAVKGGVTATKAGVATAKGAVQATKAYAKTAAATRSATAAVGKAFAKTGIKSGLRIAAQDVAKKARAVLSSKAAKAIAAQAAKAGKGMKYAATIAGKGIKTVANKKPVKIALISAKLGAKEAAQGIKDVTTPVRWYLKQMDNAYKAGFNAVDTKLTKAAQGAKMTEEVAKAKILESDIEDIKLHVSADDAPTTSAASVEQKLKDNGYTYKTEKTPDGETKFAVTADCPPNGVKRCNIVIGK